LLQCYSGWEAVDRVEFGDAHLVKQSPRVGRNGFEIAALCLGVERAKCERGFTGAGHPREHDQCVARDVEIYILEIVLAGAANLDVAARITGHLVASAALEVEDRASMAAVADEPFALARVTEAERAAANGAGGHATATDRADHVAFGDEGVLDLGELDRRVLS